MAHCESPFCFEQGTKSLSSSKVIKQLKCYYPHIQIYIFMDSFLHEDLENSLMGEFEIRVKTIM